MNVIMLKDVKTLGKEGQLVNVNGGYARNYLFPKKLAVEANAANMNVYNTRKEATAHRIEREIDKANRIKTRLEETQVILKVKAGENNKLFGAVTNNDIAKYLADKGFDIDKKKITLEETIKSTGVYEAVIKLYANISTKIKIRVDKE